MNIFHYFGSAQNMILVSIMRFIHQSSHISTKLFVFFSFATVMLFLLFYEKLFQNSFCCHYNSPLFFITFKVTVIFIEISSLTFTCSKGGIGFMVVHVEVIALEKEKCEQSLKVSLAKANE